MKITFCLFLFLVVSHSEKARFDNYRVYKVLIENSDQLKALRQLADTSDSYNFSHFPNKIGASVNLMIPPHMFAHFSDITKSLNLKHELTVTNLQEAFDKELPIRTARGDVMNWTEYHSVETIHAWLDALQTEFSNWVTVTSIGTSFEGRPLKLLKLSKKKGNRAIFVESHVHAREWIASATTTFVINELLRSSNPEVLDLADNIDWYFLVITNPDGYEYTRTQNRNWRKTRSVQSPLCWGVDPNRNFAHNWMVPDEYGTTGSSTSPCSDVFSGMRAFSEPETAAIDKFLSEHPGIFDAYLDVHSYDHSILYPYGNSRAPVWNDNELLTVGTAAADRLFAKHGIRYKVGNQALILYPASGNAQDHAFGRYNIPISFTYEMRGTGDYGDFGFFLPPQYIVPNAEEVLESLIGLVQKAREFGRF